MSDNNDAQSSANVTTLFKYDTEFSADSVEWCPHDPYKNYFACANYQLDEGESNASTTTRFGRILLFSVSTSGGLQLHQTINTSAVLDQKWCHNKVNDSIVLGIVNAKKTLELYRLCSDRVELKLLTKCVVVDNETETLLLSLDWSTGKFIANDPRIVVSDSKGNVHHFRYANDELTLLKTWHAHDYEAWICAFYYWDDSIVFTGGDDSKLLKFDVRVGDTPVAIVKNHTAGVTCIHSNYEREFLFASGSYDTNLMLWDMRTLKRSLGCVQMPGTLWRLKWDPHDRRHLLAACMLDGVHVVDVENAENPAIIANYYEHKNISYGADWSYLNETDVASYGDGNRILATCSFYDHLLCVSKLKL